LAHGADFADTVLVMVVQCPPELSLFSISAAGSLWRARTSLLCALASEVQYSCGDQYENGRTGCEKSKNGNDVISGPGHDEGNDVDRLQGWCDQEQLKKSPAVLLADPEDLT
jgi:hypothetical protein